MYCKVCFAATCSTLYNDILIDVLNDNSSL